MSAKKNNSSLFYKDKPVFGLDVGYSSVKVMQVEHRHGGNISVAGFGLSNFNPAAVRDGVIVDFNELGRCIKELFEKNITGDISTHRVCLAIPAMRAFSRNMKLPKVEEKQLQQAVQLEAEQYIPVPINDLYLDYDVVRGKDDAIEILAVAAPKKVLDSYIDLVNILGLEAAAIETNISAGARLFVQAEESDVPTLLIDFGSISTDLTIYDKGLVVTGTVAGGGDVFTDLISKTLGVSKQEADVIKTKYGLDVSKKQIQIQQALEPALNALTKEIRRMIRYFEERTGSDRKISQIVTMGGGANLPGLSDHLTNMMRLPARMCSPWQRMQFGRLQPPNELEKSLYVTVAGLSLISPKELFA